MSVSTRFESMHASLEHDTVVIQTLRDEGMAHVCRLGLPHVKQEAWRYTAMPELLASVADDACVAMTGGVVALTPPEGVCIKPLKRALQEEPDAVALYGLLWSSDADAMAALNQAFVSDGLWIDVPAGVVVEAPLMLTTSAEGHSDRHPRVLIRLGAGSVLRIVEIQSTVNLAENHICNSVYEAVVGEGATLEHSRLQEGGSQGALISRVGVKLAKNSVYRSHVATLGGGKVREDLLVHLEGEHAHCDLKGLVAGFEDDHMDHHTCVEHRVPNTTSEQNYRAMLGGRAVSVYNGRIYVAQDAQKTNAQQSSRSLVMSPHAVANSKPELEIYADDVKCAHGCTVGRLDADTLFYLRSRGLSYAQAMRMLTFAFADAVLDPCQHDRVHGWLNLHFESRA